MTAEFFLAIAHPLSQKNNGPSLRRSQVKLKKPAFRPRPTPETVKDGLVTQSLLQHRVTLTTRDVPPSTMPYHSQENRIVKLWNYVCKLAPPTRFCSPNAFQLFVCKLMTTHLSRVYDLKYPCTWTLVLSCPCHS